MDITWHGHSCFTIKGKSATIITDPYQELGTKLPNIKADIVTFGDELAEKTGKKAEVEGDAKVLDWPGEFEVSNVAIEAFSAERFARNGESNGSNVNIFIFAIDDIKICHLSGLAHELTDELLDQIGDIDILLLPVGGGAVLEAKAAQTVMEEIEPRVVIPMYFADSGSNLEIKGAQEFLKAIGKTELESKEKYSVEKSQLTDGLMDFVLLEAQN